MELPLQGKVAIVTGSSSGIGEAAARRLGSLGATVVVNSARSITAGEAVAASIEGALYVQGDVANSEDCARLIDTTLERFGKLDILINNAGTTSLIPHGDLDAATVEIWREIFEVNVFGTWQLTVAAAPALKATSGSIVMVTSIAGVRPTGSSIPYAASKAALNHLTVLLAKSIGSGVRVNAVAPGLVDTPWTKDWDAIRGFVAAASPLGRSATPEDCADVIEMLSTSPYITGQVVVIDGGLTLVT